MKILIDMNLSPEWAGVLHRAGIDAVHWSHIGPANAPDPAIMAYAAANGFTILTNDLDFGVALATAGGGVSVVQIRGGDLRPASIGDALVRALCQMRLELDEGALMTFDSKRTRLRLLPLRKIE